MSADDQREQRGLDLDALEELERAATRGPWQAENDVGASDVWLVELDGQPILIARRASDEDGALIATARNALSDLIAAARERDRLRDMVAEFRKREETQERIRERLTGERDEARATVDTVRKLAAEWADQPTDYDEDTEQQIADGRTLRGLLGDQP